MVETIRRVGILGMTVLGVFTVVLLPFASVLGHVVQRVFPFHRGIFEDYVSNVWVALAPLLRLREMDHNAQEQMLRISTVCTLVMMFPSMYQSFVALRIFF